MLFVLISFDEAILMSTHNIQFHDKIRKFHLIFVFLELTMQNGDSVYLEVAE